MIIELKCINCNKPFNAEYKHRDKKFCNRSCYFEYANKTKTIGRKVDVSIREIRECSICQTKFEVKKNNTKKLCSDKCRKQWGLISENKNKRLEAGKQVVLLNHGVDSIFKKQTFKDNYENLIMEKYGVDNPMKDSGVVTTLKNTLKIKQLNTLLPKLLENKLELLDEYSVNKNGNTSLAYNFKCLKCNNVFTSTVMGSGKIPICRKCFPMIKNSKLEESIRDFLNIHNIKHLDNSRTILKGQELDLFVEAHNLGIEINGNYYHSETYGEKDRWYHLNKSKAAEANNINLIHIFEDELLYKKDIVISRLSNLLNLNNTKIFARNCHIREVDKSESSKFLEENHIQGNSIDKIRYGLYHNDLLVSVMTFGGKRNALGNKSKVVGEYELIRFANLINTNVVGGFSRLLKNFIKFHSPTKIITYAEIRWSGLNPLKTVYHKNGFNFINHTPPNYWYLKVNQFNNRFHRFNFRKDVLIKEGYDPKLTEWEIMKLKGYDRIWDCGNMKFELIV